MSARPALCGGYRVSGIPTAIANYPTRMSYRFSLNHIQVPAPDIYVTYLISHLLWIIYFTPPFSLVSHFFNHTTRPHCSVERRKYVQCKIDCQSQGSRDCNRRLAGHVAQRFYRVSPIGAQGHLWSWGSYGKWIPRPDDDARTFQRRFRKRLQLQSATRGGVPR